MRLRRRLSHVESLEPRRLFASDWQNAVNRLDVDASGFVAPIDVLLVVNDINQNGARTLPANKPAGYTGPLCDTSGDGLVSALDALLVVNAINQFPDAPTLQVGLSQASDANGDHVVLTPNVVYEGTSVPNISVKVERLEGELSTVQLQTTASSNGTLQLPLTLNEPINHLRFTVSDPRGRSIATERIVRKGDAIAAWNAALLETVRHTTSPSTSVPGLLIKPPPPMVAKYLAMVHGAMFDAINAIDQSFDSYALAVSPPTAASPAASPVAAAAVAAHRVASNLYPTAEEVALWDLTLAEIMATVPEGSAKTLGIALGEQAASAMLAERSGDGSDATANYTPGSEPGKWRPSAPGFENATLPQWPGVKPFAIASGDQYRPAPPPALTSSAYAEALEEVQRLGSAASTERTADQTAIAHFWADGGGTSTPPGHWNQIAIDVGLEQNQSLLENARMMALLNFAMVDAGIASWDAKYAHDLWRPIDAVRLANTDGNSATMADTAWTPLLNTPSFPTYVSGHSTFSAAAAEVLTAVFGGDLAFTTRADRGSSGQWPPLEDISQLQVRSFSSFDAAAEEAGVSRIYGGIHFNFDNSAGLAAGQSVGQWVVTTMLLPK